jgi:hypothetical protein
MFKKLFFVAALGGLFAVGCKNESANTAGGEATATDTTTQTQPAPAAASGGRAVDGLTCYISVEGKDTTFFSFVSADGEMKGSYHWHPFGKDGAHGNLQGTFQNGVIDAIYSYTIEGSNQQEQVMFRVEGDKIMKVVGELEDKGGILKLKDPSKPVRMMTFVKGPCNSVD